jgi:hypothetical protein
MNAVLKEPGELLYAIDGQFHDVVDRCRLVSLALGRKLNQPRSLFKVSG